MVDQDDERIYEAYRSGVLIVGGDCCRVSQWRKFYVKSAQPFVPKGMRRERNEIHIQKEQLDFKFSSTSSNRRRNKQQVLIIYERRMENA